jgi:glycosyltransferase involved in cell wall biosynthesis
MSTHYKGQDVLLRAIGHCRDRGVRLELQLIGEGAIRSELERLARDLQIADRVVFTGQLPHGGRLLEHLDRADICAVPSRTEGLPRSLIEAMARGLPCVGSDIGGIPELLDAPERVPPGDVEALSNLLIEISKDPARLARLSSRNLGKAREYAEPLLEARRQKLYDVLRRETDRWSSARPGITAS